MVISRFELCLVCGVAWLATACRPSVEGRASLVEDDRVLAVQSVPAEAKPDTPVTYNVLLASPDGSVDASKIDWALCKQRKAIAQAGTVSVECFVPKGKVLQPLGSGVSVTTTLPKDACRTFGPEVPETKVGEPKSRAADPDTTGGYYEPVRVRARLADGDEYFTGVTRISCGLSGATQAQATEFLDAYRANENPGIDSLAVHRGQSDDMLEPGAEQAFSVKRGQTLTLRARWSKCPTHSECGDGICGPGEDANSCMKEGDCATPKGCTGAEPYVLLDPVDRAIVDRRETMRVSWYATAGSFDHDRTGRAEADDATYSDNAYTAPAHADQVLLWVVIRDDRGGVGFSSYKLDVR